MKNKKPRSSNNGTAEILPSRFILKGRQEMASYREQKVPEYRENPLIECLPQLWTRDEVEQLLAHFPPYFHDQRHEPDHIRLHLIENSRDFFIPQGIHFEVETRISCMLRRGYQQRNPITLGHWGELRQRLDSFQGNSSKAFSLSKARGFAMVGQSGVGKTTCIENILLHYPQVIDHSKYKERDFIQRQLVWLKLDCPQDGSIKGLCLNFFEMVDDILETNYYKNYAVGRTTVDALLPRMARVAALHSLGVLVLDEIQDLSAGKSGGSHQMLSFFVQLENTIGVPFILIGTPEALPLFKGEFRQARRASEQGDVIWPRMREIAEPTGNGNGESTIDPEWEEFVRALFAYDYLREPTTLKSPLLKDPLSRALYDESQGITAVAATLYLLAQRRAITSGMEKMTVGIIRTVARDSQQLLRKMLSRLRESGGRGPYTGDLIDVSIPTPEEFSEVVSGKTGKEILAKLQIKLNTAEPDQLKSPGRKSEPSNLNKKKPQRIKISPKAYDDDDIRKLADHAELPPSQSKGIRSLARKKA